MGTTEFCNPLREDLWSFFLISLEEIDLNSLEEIDWNGRLDTAGHKDIQSVPELLNMEAEIHSFIQAQGFRSLSAIRSRDQP